MQLIMMAEADAEMLEAAAFYEKKQRMLGKRFLAAVQDAFTTIGNSPFLYPLLPGEVRRCLLRVFPYCIVFRMAEDSVVIVAVMHLHREPDYWKEREIAR